MKEALQSDITKKFTEAVDGFVNKIKQDSNVIAIIVCGSMAYDQVWEKSDVDTTVIIKDQPIVKDSYCILENDILINVHILTRSSFKRGMERSLGGNFMQSYFAKGKMVYTTDDSFIEYFEELKVPGSDDLAECVFNLACEILGYLNKSEKWLHVKNDRLYAQFYLLKIVENMARIIICVNGESPTRECIQRAMELDPESISQFYQETMSHHLSVSEIQQRIDYVDQFLMKHMDVIMMPVKQFMADGELKTVTMFEKHFHSEGHFLMNILEYLSEKEIIEKAAQTIRITPKGRLVAEEIAYLYIS